jgi:TolA-binding protein
MDFPGADLIADRLAAANPLAQIDEKSDVPPQVQMQLAQSQQTIQDLQQQIQAMQMDMKYRASIEEQKQMAETQRTQMQVDARMADSQLRTEVQANDTIIDNETRIEIERMKAQLAFILASINTSSEKSVDAEAIERAI